MIAIPSERVRCSLSSWMSGASCRGMGPLKEYDVLKLVAAEWMVRTCGHEAARAKGQMGYEKIDLGNEILALGDVEADGSPAFVERMQECLSPFP